MNPRLPHQSPEEDGTPTTDDPRQQLCSNPADEETLVYLLLSAYERSRNRPDCWLYSLEMSLLLSLNVDVGVLRDWVLQGYLKAGRELTRDSDKNRTIVEVEHPSFCNKSCFQLTATGKQFLAMKLKGDESTDAGSVLRIASPEEDLVPHYDIQRRKLYFGSLLVKNLSVRAANQHLFLKIFEQKDWPGRINNPLTSSAETSAIRRLHNTIYTLNLRHTHRLLKFTSDGNGQGVIWTRYEQTT